MLSMNGKSGQSKRMYLLIVFYKILRLKAVDVFKPTVHRHLHNCRRVK